MCLHHFSSQERLKNHEADCSMQKPVKIVMPEKGEYISFKNYQHTMKVPFVI
jgi:hypothetical protein